MLKVYIHIYKEGPASFFKNCAFVPSGGIKSYFIVQKTGSKRLNNVP